MADPSPKPPLEYERTGSTVTVRGFRTLVVLTLINTIVLLWFALAGQQGPQYVRDQWRQWQQRREVRKHQAAALALQQQCMTYAAAPETIAYTEDPDRAAALMKSGGGAYQRVRVSRSTVPGWTGPVTMRPPATWTSLNKHDRANHGFRISGTPVVFLHERATPLGERRLVVVELMTEQRFESGRMELGRLGPDRVRTARQLNAFAYVPFTPGTQPTWISARADLLLPPEDTSFVTRAPDGSYTVQRAPPLTIFAGQPDPDDPTHFTIGYDIAGQAGVIDGWLLEGEIVLKPRSGIARFDSGNPIWELGVSAPADRPASRPATGP